MLWVSRLALNTLSLALPLSGCHYACKTAAAVCGANYSLLGLRSQLAFMQHDGLRACICPVRASPPSTC